MNSDYYAALGVSATAEDVVIRAAYRALMRHYHPDSNPDPEAHARARAITEAYFVLRDPGKRAEYDAGLRAGGDLWRSVDEPPRPPARPPAMRTGMGAAVLAAVTVGLVWVWPHSDQPKPRTHAAATVKPPPKARAAPSQPIIDLAPENERLASLAGIDDVVPPPVAPPPVAIEQAQPEPLPDPIASVRHASALPTPARAARKRPPPLVEHVAAAPASVPVPKAPAASPKPVAAASPPPAANNERLAILQRMSASFYNQAMAHADAAKKEMLVSAHGRFTTRQGACHSDSCVADSYLRQIRDISAIMENRASPEN